MGWRFAMGCLAAWSLIGCGNQAAVDAANAVAEDLCACKKLECAQTMWQKHAEKLKAHEDARGSEDDRTKILEAGKRAQACITKLREAAAKP